MHVVLLLLHGLAAAALLGALSHQAVAAFTRRAVGASFAGRYAAVRAEAFVPAVVALYVGVTLLGALLYPAYRVDARIAFEELGLFAAVGAFELKEHAAGIGLGLLPLYAYLWRGPAAAAQAANRRWITLFLAAVVWFDFLAGHVLNNIRGIE